MDLVVKKLKSESLLSLFTYNASSRKALLGSQNPTQWTHTPFFERVIDAIFSNQRETFPPIHSFGSAESLVQKSLRDH